MTTAVITLDVGGQMQSCRTLMLSLEQHGRMPDETDRLVLCSERDPAIDFAIPVPVTIDYSDLSPKPDNEDSFKRLFAFLMPYDRVIYLDPDLLCVGDVSALWSEAFGQRLLYARHQPDGRFEDSLMVFNPDLLPGFHDALIYLVRNHVFDCFGYTCQGLLNGYFIYTELLVGAIPPNVGIVRNTA